MAQTRLTLERDSVRQWSIEGEAEWQEMCFEVGGKVHRAVVWIAGEYADVLLLRGIESILDGRGQQQEGHKKGTTTAVNNLFHSSG